jgi:hypothetical protein
MVCTATGILQSAAQELADISQITPIEYSADMAEKVLKVWHLESIQQLLRVANEFSLSDSAP